MAPKTWLITGCTSGFGVDFVREAIQRGDKAIATGRGDISRLNTVKEAGAHVYTLDVTSPAEEINQTVQKMIREVGDIDVLVNNAGYAQIGLVGELELQSWHDIFETNFFGSLKLTQAILPHFRERKTGNIVFISSMFGLTGQIGVASYSATKFALEGLHDALQGEITQFGIRSFIFEPGVFGTAVAANMQHYSKTAPLKKVEELAPIRDFWNDVIDTAVSARDEKGDSMKCVKIMVDIVRGEGVAEGREVPNRLPIGVDAWDIVRPKALAMPKQWDEWENVIKSTDRDDLEGKEEPEYAKRMRASRQGS